MYKKKGKPPVTFSKRSVSELVAQAKEILARPEHHSKGIFGGIRPLKPQPTRICKLCKRKFYAFYGKQYCCSDDCSRAEKYKHRKLWQEYYKPPKHRLIHVGAAAAMLTVCDLLRQGWHVFNAVSAACPYDLMISFDGTHYSVECKRGIISMRQDTVRHGMRKKGETPTIRPGTDIVAVVILETHQVFYFDVRDVGAQTTYRVDDVLDMVKLLSRCKNKRKFKG